MNKDLLTKTLDHIEQIEAFRAEGIDTDQRWDQNEWAVLGAYKNDDGEWVGDVCSTTACFFGWACHLAGDRFEKAVPDEIDPTAAYVATAYVAVDPDGNREQIRTRAQQLLGLDDDQADELSSWCNDLDDIRAIVAFFLGDGPEPTGHAVLTDEMEDSDF